ncbi:MAG: HsdR family type I site-specific deoxyribonuclease, partial [Snowella sp.]|nr:HsdR family type I site-specific deoxyribonuclease [Snowella sp.]
YYLAWKEDPEDDSRIQLDKYLLKLCNPQRLLEIIHDFIVFDAGIKKLPRFHQYFGIKAAQEYVKRKEGGIIWHTQGSGKSIVMVLLAKWILENNPYARVAIITDRTELDDQIRDVFFDAGEEIHQSSSGRDLINQLTKATPRLLCSLIHKFGKQSTNNFENFIKDLKAQPISTVGEIFIFVDECHRTQSGKLHTTMKTILPQATFIGFTGTPLLSQDEKDSREVFGKYIHTYKFNEAVEDGIVLDLVYEARDIDQRLGSEDKIDAWFDAKTKGLNEWQKARLRKEWGTLQKVLSSKSRMERIVQDIIFDFSVKPRLSDSRGTAILVASSIYEGCKYFQLFQQTPLKNKCAIITSYNPQTKDITTEDTGADSETDKEFIYNTYVELLKNITAHGGKSRTEVYEEQAKETFKKSPAQMKLLIVVNKLLTGFDAPSCTYIYLDKKLQDHGLFQAICRTNRLDGDDKTYGYIVGYKDLFGSVTKAIGVYTSELAKDELGLIPQVVIQERLSKAKDELDNALEAVFFLCEPVEPPKDSQDYIRYFCGNPEIQSDIDERAFRRNAFYQAIAALVRAYAQIANELESAGYSAQEAVEIKQKVNDYKNLRDVIRAASGEYLDLKPYEADMRHLIDTYIEADEPRKISDFDHLPLVDLILKTSIQEAVDQLPPGIRNNRRNVAETIENNVRRVIVQEQLNDPAYYAKMSALLDDLIQTRKREAIAYEELLKRYAELAQKVRQGKEDNTPPELDTPGKLALYNNLDHNLALALQIDATVKQVRPDGWRGQKARENVIKKALFDLLNNGNEVERIFIILENQPEY